MFRVFWANPAIEKRIMGINIKNFFIVFYLFVKRKNVRLYTCPSLILGRRKPLVNDEQIESHAESYTYPRKVCR